MFKSIIKELIIVLLLLLAILLVLGVFLYDYIPTTKVVPKVEQYQRPNNVENEISSQTEEEDYYTPSMVYEIDGTDLKNYEKAKDYQKGKVNPFSEDATKDTNNGENTNNNNSNTNNNSITNKNTNSVGNYLPNTGTK